MSEETASTVILNVSVLPWQKAMVEQLRKDEGYLSVSEAMRRVLTEWRNFKAVEAGIPTTVFPQEQPA